MIVEKYDYEAMASKETDDERLQRLRLYIVHCTCEDKGDCHNCQGQESVDLVGKSVEKTVGE